MNGSIVKAGGFITGVGAVSTLITAGTCPFCVITFATGIATTAVGAALPGTASGKPADSQPAPKPRTRKKR